MVKLLLGIWTPDEGSSVKFKSPMLAEKEANKLLENVLFSTNIYGNKSNKIDVAFTIPIMYLPSPYTHGRIYFKFRLMEMNTFTPIEEIRNFDFSNKRKFEILPISIFCSLPFLNETVNTKEMDDLIWRYLNTTSLEQEEFLFLFHQINVDFHTI